MTSVKEDSVNDGRANQVLDDEGHDMKLTLQVGDRFYTPQEFIEESMQYRAVYTPTGLKNPK